MARNPSPILKKLDYPVPSYANRLLYMFGGISSMAFVVLIATGIFLSQIYKPTPDGAHQSIVYAVTYVPLADFTRSLHFWTANLVVALLLFHIIRVFITGSYKKPRVLTWLTGVALLFVTTIYIFVGTVLKWDQEGVEALGHMKESFQLFGIHLGLTNAGVPIITQLYSWHTTILLLALLGLLVIHMILIKLTGISAKPARGAVSAVTAGQGSSGFLTHLRRLGGFGLLFLATAGLLGILFPAPIGHAGILNQEVTKPLWMFWPFFGLENIYGLKGLVFGMAAFFGFLAVVPFIDRSPYLHWSQRKLILSLGALLLAATVGLAVYSRVAPQASHLGMEGSTDGMTIAASAVDLRISHQELRDEAIILVPVLLGIGLAGWRLALKREENS